MDIPNMYGVGIDVSKGRSTVAIVRPYGVIECKPFEVQHTLKDLADLASKLKSLPGEVRIVMEYTGRYYEAICNTLHAAGFFVSVVNPLLINGYNADSIRKVKTDKADAIKMANFALDKWYRLQEYNGMDELRYNLKTMNRQFQLFVKQQTESKNNLIALSDQSLPGVRDLFTSPAKKDGTQKWVDFFCTFYHADCIRKCSQKAFTERYRKWCKRHKYQFNEEKATEIYEWSKGMVVSVTKSEAHKFIVQQACRQLVSITKTVEAYRAEMDQLASRLPEYTVVMDMYGTGPSLGPQLMAEIGDPMRFASGHSLVAYAGIDPEKHNSGDMNIRSTKTTKRGSPYLRRTLYNVMRVYLQRAPEEEPVYQFMQKKKAEGKPFYVYMVAAENKFLRQYYGKIHKYMTEQKALQNSSAKEETDNPADPTAQQSSEL